VPICIICISVKKCTTHGLERNIKGNRSTEYVSALVRRILGTMAKGKQGPEDFAQAAFRVVRTALGEIPKEEPPESGKDPAAVALGRKGGLKGGKARAANMTPEERSEAARKAVQSRWSVEKNGK
jgi:hypothetical protein